MRTTGPSRPGTAGKAATGPLMGHRNRPGRKAQGRCSSSSSSSSSSSRWANGQACLLLVWRRCSTGMVVIHTSSITLNQATSSCTSRCPCHSSNTSCTNSSSNTSSSSSSDRQPRQVVGHGGRGDGGREGRGDGKTRHRGPDEVPWNYKSKQTSTITRGQSASTATVRLTTTCRSEGSRI